MGVESAAQWFRQPEWEYLLDMLQDVSNESMDAFVSIDANDPAAVGRLQGLVKVCRQFTSGGLREGMMKELKEKEAKNG